MPNLSLITSQVEIRPKLNDVSVRSEKAELKPTKRKNKPQRFSEKRQSVASQPGPAKRKARIIERNYELYKDSHEVADIVSHVPSKIFNLNHPYEQDESHLNEDINRLYKAQGVEGQFIPNHNQTGTAEDPGLVTHSIEIREGLEADQEATTAKKDAKEVTFGVQEEKVFDVEEDDRNHFWKGKKNTKLIVEERVYEVEKRGEFRDDLDENDSDDYFDN